MPLSPNFKYQQAGNLRTESLVEHAPAYQLFRAVGAEFHEDVPRVDDSIGWK